MPITRVETQWTLPSGRSGQTVMHTEGITSITETRQAIADLWGSFTTYLTSDTTWNVAQEGYILNELSGDVEGVWSDPTPFSDSGAANPSQALPDSTQLLLRWSTGVYHGGREIRGRTFVPGLAELANDSGNVDPLLIVSAATAGNALAATTRLLVWSRPVPGRQGRAAIVTSSTCWSEWAVQRQRRTR